MTCAAALAAGAAAPCPAQEVVAVLGSDMRPYHQAYEGFQASFGKEVPVLELRDEILVPKQAKVVVAFGGRAAAKGYPARVTLVYGMAPGMEIGADTHDGKSIRIHMEPAPAVVLARLLELQPRLKKLAFLWSSGGFASFSRAVKKAGAAASVDVSSVRLENSQRLPETLRGLKDPVDAIWLPADPTLVTPQNFEVIRQFSYGKHIAFYAPTEGLVERGATASVSVGYGQIGSAAAETARSVLAGGDVPSDIYVKESEVSVNLTAAKEIALVIPAEALKKAHKIFP